MPPKDNMTLQTFTTDRPKLSLQFGRTNRPSPERHPAPGILSALELQRIVSEMVG